MAYEAEAITYAQKNVRTFQNIERLQDKLVGFDSYNCLQKRICR